MTGVRPEGLREAARQRLLTLVLLTVLVWYTLVVPAPAAFVRHSAGLPRDAEERGEESATEPPPADDLDWPEYIAG